MEPSCADAVPTRLTSPGELVWQGRRCDASALPRCTPDTDQAGTSPGATEVGRLYLSSVLCTCPGGSWVLQLRQLQYSVLAIGTAGPALFIRTTGSGIRRTGCWTRSSRTGGQAGTSGARVAGEVFEATGGRAAGRPEDGRLGVGSWRTTRRPGDGLGGRSTCCWATRGRAAGRGGEATRAAGRGLRGDRRAGCGASGAGAAGRSSRTTMRPGDWQLVGRGTGCWVRFEVSLAGSIPA